MMDWISDHLNTIGIGILIAGALILLLANSSVLTSTLARALSDFSLLKLVYSLIILSLATLLLSESYRVWLGGTNQLGAFRYFEKGGEKADRGKEMVLRIADHHGKLLRAFANVKESDVQSEQRLVPTTGKPIEGAKNVLQDVDITIQKINVTDVLAHFRRWVTAPKEIVGTVSKTGASFRASLELIRWAMAEPRRWKVRLFRPNPMAVLGRVCQALCSSARYKDDSPRLPQAARHGLGSIERGSPSEPWASRSTYA